MPDRLSLHRTSQRAVEDFDRHRDEAPAPLAHGLVLTARSDLVVVGHVDIKDELAQLRLERGLEERLAVFRLSTSESAPTLHSQ